MNHAQQKLEFSNTHVSYLLTARSFVATAGEADPRAHHPQLGAADAAEPIAGVAAL